MFTWISVTGTPPVTGQQPAALASTFLQLQSANQPTCQPPAALASTFLQLQSANRSACQPLPSIDEQVTAQFYGSCMYADLLLVNIFNAILPIIYFIALLRSIHYLHHRPFQTHAGRDSSYTRAMQAPRIQRQDYTKHNTEIDASQQEVTRLPHNNLCHWKPRTGHILDWKTKRTAKQVQEYLRSFLLLFFFMFSCAQNTPKS